MKKKIPKSHSLRAEYFERLSKEADKKIKQYSLEISRTFARIEKINKVNRRLVAKLKLQMKNARPSG